MRVGFGYGCDWWAGMGVSAQLQALQAKFFCHKIFGPCLVGRPKKLLFGPKFLQSKQGLSVPHPGDLSASSKPKRSKRAKTPNVRLAGPDWTCAACEVKTISIIVK